MKNKNHPFDDIDFGIYLAEEGDTFFAQEEVSPVKSLVTLSQLQFIQRHNMLGEGENQHDESKCFPFC